MRIAILTLPLHTNYGGILQCYALQTVLERMGHDVKVLDKPLYKRSYYIYWGMAILKRIIKKLVLRQNISILYAPYQIERKIIRKNTDPFIKKYIHRFVKRRWNCSLAKYFDAFVVGSDQVWRPSYAKNVEQYFLSFLRDSNTKRISYAASFGFDICDEYSFKQIETCSTLLKKFDAVSVREDSAVNLCKKYFGVNAVQMLDPTLLLSADDYIELIKCEYTEPFSGNMLVYILDKTDDKVAIANRIAAEKKLKPFWIDISSNDIMQKCGVKPFVSIAQWLRAFLDAEFVFTDSYHGCIFSIIFHKQFIAIGNEYRGLSRFTSLLDLFSLRNKLILTKDEYNRVVFDEIDFKKIDVILNDWRKSAFDFLSLQ